MDSFLSLFAAACTKPTFLGLKPWYQYLPFTNDSVTKQCEVSFNVLGKSGDGKASDIILVLLAIVNDLLIIAGIVAVIYVIYSGVKYIMSQGSPDETSKAQSTLVNALLGLAIALIAVAFVSFLGNYLAGGGGSSSDGTTLNVGALPHTTADAGTVKRLLQVVFSIVGGLALLVITIGGFRYVLSQGDPQATGKAKNAILYALVGLVIAAIAQTIVTFVVGKV